MTKGLMSKNTNEYAANIYVGFVLGTQTDKTTHKVWFCLILSPPPPPPPKPFGQLPIPLSRVNKSMVGFSYRGETWIWHLVNSNLSCTHKFNMDPLCYCETDHTDHISQWTQPIFFLFEYSNILVFFSFAHVSVASIR